MFSVSESLLKHVHCSQTISMQCYMMKYYNLCCHNNEANQCILNILIYHRAAQILLHAYVSLTLMRLTADVLRRMGKPHSYISLSAGTSCKCLSVQCCAACLWIRGCTLILFFCSEHVSELWTPLAGYHCNCKSWLLSRFPL